MSSLGLPQFHDATAEFRSAAERLPGLRYIEEEGRLSCGAFVRADTTVAVVFTKWLQHELTDEVEIFIGRAGHPIKRFDGPDAIYNALMWFATGGDTECR